MMNPETLKRLESDKELLSDKYFDMLQKSDFAKRLDRLCLSFDGYCSSYFRLSKYEEINPCDENTLQVLREEVLITQVDFYKIFVDVVEKYDYVSKYFRQNTDLCPYDSYFDYINKHLEDNNND